MKNSRLSTSIWSITAGSNVPLTHARYASYCVDGRRAIHAAVYLAFITDDDAKMVKNATDFFAYN